MRWATRRTCCSRRDLAWLLLFFAVPLINQLWVSLQTGNADDGLQLQRWSVYPDAIIPLPRRS